MKYKIEETPVLVRKDPSPDSPVVNVLNPGRVIEVIKLENGWFKLINEYYVFKTDNIKLYSESDMLPKLSDKRENRIFIDGIQRFAPDPSNASTTPTPSGQTTPGTGQGYNQSAQAALGTNPTAGPTDTANGAATRISIEEINNTFTGPNTEWVSNPGGMAYEVGTDGNIVLNDDGTYKVIPMPATLLMKGNGSTVISVDDNAYVTVRDINGNIYKVLATEGQVSLDPNSDDYYTIPVTEEMLANREATNLKNAMARFNAGDFSAFFTSLVNINKVDISNIHGIFGYPYQFLPTVDPRIADSDLTISTIEKRGTATERNWYISSDNLNESLVKKLLQMDTLGEQFARKIAARAPVLTLQAGVPVFLKGYSDQARSTILESLLGVATDAISGISLDDVLSSSGQYYSFQPSPNEYFEAVNAVCRAISIFLNIDTYKTEDILPWASKIGEGLIDEIDWKKHSEHAYVGYYAGSVCFYLNAEPQIHEQFTNGTRQSQLASSINQISDQALEIQFILGGLGAAAGKTFDWPTSGITNINEDLTDASHFRSGTGLVQSMIKNIRTFLSGGKMIFPEIWSDSSFGRNYNVTIKLVSPDCDRLSIYLNILVPLAHILGFVMPRSVGDNSYISPFLVRCWYASQFNIELGIVSSCEVIKGDAGTWTQEGLPTQVTVQLSIKDLYSVMSYPLNTSTSNILTNPALLNYISNLCGLNIGPVDLSRTWMLWKMLVYNKAKDTVKGFLPNLLAYKFGDAYAALATGLGNVGLATGIPQALDNIENGIINWYNN